MADCVGSECKYFEFSLSEITVKHYIAVDSTSKAHTKQTNVPQDMQDEFKKGLEKLYAPFGKCEDGCVCDKTAKVLKGPTIPGAPIEHTHTTASGFDVEGTYKVSITVFEGICAPTGKTKSSTHGQPASEKKKGKKAEPSKKVARRG